MTPVDICNVALGLIGQSATIASIDPPEQSNEAQKAALFWPSVRDQTLAAHTWSFAVRRIGLALSSVTPPTPWLYTYAKPGDCVKFIGVRDPNAIDDAKNEACRLGSESGAEVIYSNIELAVGVWVHREVNSALYPPSLVVAQQYLMASRLAGPIITGTAGMQAADSMLQKGMGYLKMAKTEDASQGNLKDMQNVSTYKASQLEARGATTETSASRILRS